MTGMYLPAFTPLYLALLLLPAYACATEGESPKGETAYVINDYRYDPGGSGGDPDAGHMLCATRCNALSSDFRNYVDPGGWRMIKVAENRELTIPLSNPFLDGNCICAADEYLIVVNDFNRPDGK